MPVVGNTADYARDPLAFITACRQAYGDLAHVQLGPEDVYLITEPTATEQVLVSEADKFGRATGRGDPFGDLLGHGLLRSEGGLWQRQRRRMQPAFQLDQLTGVADRTIEYTNELTADWTDGDDIVIDTEMARTTIRVIVDAMMGVQLDDRTTQTIIDQMDPIGGQLEPSLRDSVLPDWIPTRQRQQFENAVTTLEEILEQILRDRGPVADDETDMLSLLLHAQSETAEVDRELIRDEMMTMLLAGHDTTELLLTYTWFLLAQHPEVEQQVHNELDTVLGGETPTVHNVDELEYLMYVLQEVLRLYPPVYMMIRETREPVHLAGYQVPKDSLVMLSQWAVHRDSRWYDDPETFDPERWQRTSQAERPTGQYFPFGAGPHLCIGRQLSLLEARAVIGTIAQTYRLELAERQTTSLDFRPAVTIHPQDPVDMVVRER